MTRKYTKTVINIGPFRCKEISEKNQVRISGISLEEFNAGREGVPISELRYNSCRAIVSGEKDKSLYCNAKRILGSRCCFCSDHAQYFFTKEVRR